jgi:transposase
LGRRLSKRQAATADKANQKVARRRRARQTGAIIEVEIDGVTVRVGSGVDAKTVAAVIRALRAGA